GRRLWPVVPDRRVVRHSRSPGEPLVWIGRAWLVAWPRFDRARCFDIPSRPSRTGLARVFAMAQLLAVARGRAVAFGLPAGGHLGHRLAVLRPGPHLGRLAERGLGGPDHLLHRHDLCLAETYPALAQCLGSAELPAARPDDRRIAPSVYARSLRTA